MNIYRKTIIKITLASFTVIAVAGYFWWSWPMQFERSYLAKQRGQEAARLKEPASARGFYLGASTDEVSELQSTNFRSSFNSSTPESLFKLGRLLSLANNPQASSQPHYDFSAADRWLKIATQEGIRTRGHTLIWGRLSDDYEEPDIQRWLDTFTDENIRKQKLSELMENHISRVLEHYRGRVFQWDVVNEPLELMGQGELDENVFTRYLGKEYIALALQRAHKVDPSLKLYINEQLHNYRGGKALAFYTLVKELLKQGIPLHGVGLQHHMLFHLENAKSTKEYMARFEALGLEVEITELDARLRLFKNHDDPYEAQGDYYAQIVDACLQVTACQGVTFWGVNDADTWHDELGYMFPKPNEPYLFDAENHAKPGVGAIAKVLAVGEDQ